MNNWYVYRRQKGQALVEVIVALGILVLIASAFARLSIGSFDGYRQAREHSGAVHFAQEGLEGARSIAERDFDELIDGAHALEDELGYYTFSGATNTFGKYSRTITVSAVQRDENGDIVESGGTVDDQTKGVTSTVTWLLQQGRPQSLSLYTLLTVWAGGSWIVDLITDLSNGYFNSTQTTEVNDGEVQLIARGDITSWESHISVNLTGNADILAMHVDAVADRVYASLGSNTGPEFFAYDMSTISDGVLTLTGSVELGEDSPDFALTTDYAYVLTNDNAGEVRVVDLSSMTVVSTWDIDSDDNPLHIIADEAANRAYLVTQDSDIPGPTDSSEFYVLDISNPLSATPVVVAEAEISQDVNAVGIANGFAYIVTNGNTNELQIIDLTNTSTIQECDLLGTQDAVDIHVEGTRLFIARTGGSNAEFVEYEIDAGDPSDCAYITSHITGETQLSTDSAMDMSVHTKDNLVVLTVLNNAQEIRVVDLSTYTSSATDAAGLLCDSGTFLGGYLYAGCRDNTDTLQVFTVSGVGAQEDIFTEGLQNSWTISDSGGAVTDTDNDDDNALLVRTGAQSLWINPATGGYSQFAKSISLSASGALEFYANTVSPWAFGLYSNNGGTPSTSTTSNLTYGSRFETNAEEGAFTDFPVLDYDAVKADADTVIIHTANSNLTWTTADLALHAGELVFIEITRSNRDFNIDFGNLPLPHNISIVFKGGRRMNLSNYGGVLLTPKSASYPVFATQNEMRFTTNAAMTISGFLYTEAQVNTTSLNGLNRIVVNGSIVAGTIDNSLERITQAYTTDLHSALPLHFSPSYSGQSLSVSADIGSSVAMSDYISLDSDLSTWQKFSIPFADLGVGSSSISYIRFTDTSGTNQPTFFIDDMQVRLEAQASSEYVRYGTYTSPIFDATNAVNWSEIAWTRGTGTGSLVLRIRTANTEANLKQAMWVGPDGTAHSSYADDTGESVTVDPGATGTRFVQWKAYFSGSGSNTPVLEDVSLTYN